MKSKLLIFLLALSLVANAYFVLFEEQPSLDKGQVQDMQININNLQKENEDLHAQINQNNQSLQSYASQLNFYRKKVFKLENKSKKFSTGKEGALIDISVEIQPGEGRVLVQTTPLMGVVFQDAANTAVFVAENKTGKSLSHSDIIFSINANDQIPGVDGPSAGALMTLITISAIENNTKLNDSITLTGTIDNEGNIGAIGGALEKAKAAKAGGKTLFLIPRENSKLIIYKQVERNFGGFTIVERVPETVNTKDYIEKNAGIRTEYVDTIDDVLNYEK
jgi:predicted S18 family serine protease